MRKSILWAAGLTLLLSHTQAGAQASRTWVSNTGDDANPCSVTAPCKTFAGAISKTAVGGTISALNSGGFGSFTITKSINVIAEGVQAGILTAGNNGIIINAGPNDVISLQGLFIQPVPAGAGNGIQIISAGTVEISRCDIRGYQTGQGILLASSGASKVVVSDCTVSLNSGGVVAQAASQGEVVLNGVRMLGNQSAIRGAGSSAIFVLNNSVLINNNIAIDSVDGKVLSFQNNAFAGNGSDGQQMAPIGLK